MAISFFRPWWLVLLWCTAAAHAAPLPSPEDWRDINIYQIFTDRFNDGDPANNTLSPSSFNPTHAQRIHGGDFRGIDDKLDYIKALGANAIWISPIPLNVGNSAYHGYGAHDFYSLSPHWGTMDDLRRMVSNAHARGIYVILDVVCNHQGNRIGSPNSAWNNTFNAAGYPIQWNTGTQYPPPFNQLTNFHNNGAIQTYVDPNQILGELSGLDDLRTETTHVRTNMVNIYKYWIEQADFDGFRIDTVKHADMGFWQHFNPAIRAFAGSIGKSNFFQFGEVYDGDDGKCGSYTGTKAGGPYANDSVLDFPLYFRVNDVFARATAPTRNIEDRYAGIAANYHADAQARLVTFLDNHDFPRFMNSDNANNNTSRLQVATAFLYTSRGIPSLYYGTEQNFNGGADPNNREDMFNGQFPATGPSVGDRFDMTEATFRHIAMLNNFRRNYPALRRGAHHNLWSNPSGPGLFAYARRLGGEEIFVVFNTSATPQQIPARPTTYPAGTRLVNLMNTGEVITVTADTDGIPPVTVLGTSTKMFVSETLWKPLDPVVIQQTPAHAATSVSANAAIILTFNEAMHTASVASAFSISPDVSGSISWSSDRKTMTFAPSVGYASLTRYRVRLDTQATSATTSNTMHGGFDTYFVTGTSLVSDVIAPTIAVHSPAAGSTLSNTVTLTGAAADNAGVSRVEFKLDGNDWLVVSGTTAWTQTLDTALYLNGSQTLTFRSFDTSGNVSPETNLVVRFFNVPGPYEQRISAGNPGNVTDCDNAVWLADRAHTFGSFGYVGGTIGYIANTVTGVCAQAQSLYQRERYSSAGEPFRYLFDCPPGIYETVLLEAEMWVTAANQRLFNVVIENQLVRTNVDIFALAGGMNKPVSMTFTSEVHDSRLEVQFNPVIENARISGIQVRKIADVDSTGDGIPDWWMLGYFDHVAGIEPDRTRPEDDFDGDGASNRDEYIAGTSPVDDSSVLNLHAALLGEQVSVAFPTAPGRFYTLMATDILIEPQWTNLDNAVWGDGSNASIIDTNPPNNFRSYRIQVDYPR